MIEPIFKKPLGKLKKGEKVYKLSGREINRILKLRGFRNELDPGMGGVSPKTLEDLLAVSSKLVSIDIALTSGCNFKCLWCYRPGEEWGKLSIDFKTISKIIEQSADLGVRFFVLTGGEPLMYRDGNKNYFDVVDKIYKIYDKRGIKADVLTFSDVALIDKKVAEKLAQRKVGLCLKRDTLNHLIQDTIVGLEFGVKNASRKIENGYDNLFKVGYGSEPDLAISVNSVLAEGIPSNRGQKIDTFRGAVDLHCWVRSHGMEHSIVPIHYCGAASGGNQEEGINALKVKVLYDILAEIDRIKFGDTWNVYSAFPKNKTCNRPGRGVHIRATGKVTSCSESPLVKEYIFGDIFKNDFGDIIKSKKFQDFREEFQQREGKYICNPDVCDLNANHLCRGGCATRSAFSKMNPETGLIEKNNNPLAYSQGREDPLCPGWAVLAQKQGILKAGLYEGIVEKLINHSQLDSGIGLKIKKKIISEFNKLGKHHDG